MAYDLHIVRTEHWTDAARAPITRQDVDALIAADAELAWSATDYVDIRDRNRSFDGLAAFTSLTAGFATDPRRCRSSRSGC